MRKTKVGVVGTGHLGALHAKMYSQIESADLIGVYDADAGKAKKVAEDFGTRAFDRLEDLLSEAEATSIVTSTKAHHEVAMKALQHGCDILIEKPITETIEQAQEIVAVAERMKKKVQVGHIERFNAAIIALEEYTLEPLFIESHRLAQFNPRGTDVAVVLDLMIHDIDLILSLVKSPVAKIDANGVAVVSDSLDIANARLQFANGCVANVTASRISQNKMRKMRLFQRDAYISVDFVQGVAEVFRLADEMRADAKGTMLLGNVDQGARKRLVLYEQPEVKEVNALKHELTLFLRSVQEDRDPPVTGKDGIEALAVAQEILKRIESQTIRSV
ncbi:MAG: Gfo/Idh/MocA family oxidoreductase [Ignavibacteria bacterium]|nr:Gfo/Idh/MocA family oxidoreductase [Ignavibacteria bacterium]